MQRKKRRKEKNAKKKVMSCKMRVNRAEKRLEGRRERRDEIESEGIGLNFLMFIYFLLTSNEYGLSYHFFPLSVYVCVFVVGIYIHQNIWYWLLW